MQSHHADQADQELLGLKSWAMQVARRAGVRKAKVVLARRLAVILHRMLADGHLELPPHITRRQLYTTASAEPVEPSLLSVELLRKSAVGRLRSCASEYRWRDH